MWASEVWESIWQCLAIHQLSNTGMSWSLLVVYVCVVTLNTASPLIMGATLRHQRGHDGHLFLSRMTQRVLVFDASVRSTAGRKEGHVCKRLCKLACVCVCVCVCMCVCNWGAVVVCLYEVWVRPRLLSSKASP